MGHIKSTQSIGNIKLFGSYQTAEKLAPSIVKVRSDFFFVVYVFAGMQLFLLNGFHHYGLEPLDDKDNAQIVEGVERLVAISEDEFKRPLNDVNYAVTQRVEG